jgi:Fe-S cluster biogenesis protein NfuA
MAGKPEFQRRLESIEELLKQIEDSTDPHLRATAQELLQAVMDLFGTGFQRILDTARSTGELGIDLVDRLGRDELVSSLLALYGLHPLTLEDRLKRAIEKLRPSLQKRGGEVEVISIEDGVVSLKMQANGHARVLKETVEEAVYQAVPDITSLIIEGAEERGGFVPLEVLLGTAVSNGKGGL